MANEIGLEDLLECFSTLFCELASVKKVYAYLFYFLLLDFLHTSFFRFFSKSSWAGWWWWQWHWHNDISCQVHTSST